MKKIIQLFKGLSKYEDIALASLIIAVLSLIFAIVLPLKQNHDEISRKQELILGENLYNIGLINTYKTALENEELDKKLFLNRFSVEIYKNNWDIIFNLKPPCAEDLIRAIAKMDAINNINDSILNLYNQEGLVFETNQWKNTKERTAQWYADLKEKLNELDKYINDSKECKF